MAEHSVPQKLIDVAVADLVSRIAEMGIARPEGVDEALAVLKNLPKIDEGTELEIDWYSTLPPASATLSINAEALTLTVADDEGSREVYDCYAGMWPRIDSDLEAWVSYFRCLNAPEVSISCWLPNSSDTHAVRSSQT